MQGVTPRGPLTKAGGDAGELGDPADTDPAAGRRRRWLLIAHPHRIELDELQLWACTAAGAHGLDRSPRGLWQWAQVGAPLLRRSGRPDPRLHRHRCRHLESRMQHPPPVELDADRVPSSSPLTVAGQHAALLLRVPR